MPQLRIGQDAGEHCLRHRDRTNTNTWIMPPDGAYVYLFTVTGYSLDRRQNG